MLFNSQFSKSTRILHLVTHPFQLAKSTHTFQLATLIFQLALTTCAPNYQLTTPHRLSKPALFSSSYLVHLLSKSVELLRVRAFFHKSVRVCHVYCNFKIGFTCRITVTFGTLKDGSNLINTLASNICFSYRNMFQNGVDALSKTVDAFLSKSSKFHLVRIMR